MLLRTFFLVMFMLAATGVPAHAVEVKEISSPSGFKAWLVEDHTIPIVSLRFSFAQGSIDDPPEQKGASILLSGLVDEGAGGLSGEDFRTRIEDIGLRLAISDTPDSFDVGFSVPSPSLAEATQLMAMALSSLDFPEEAVERMRSQLLTYVESSNRNPETLGVHAFFDLALPGHPYARDDDGLREGVERLSRTDLIAAHKRIFSTAGLQVAIVGDATEADAIQLLEQLFGGLPQGKPQPSPPVATTVAGPKIQVIPFNQPQTLLLFGNQGIPENDPDSLAGQIATSIIAATLHQIVREQRGYTYEATFDNMTREASNIALGKLWTQNQTADDALAAVKEAMALALNFTAKENVAATIRYFKGVSALGAETNGELASQLLSLQKKGYASNYLAINDTLLDQVTTEDVQRAMRRLVKPENLIVVAVGQPEGLIAE